MIAPGDPGAGDVTALPQGEFHVPGDGWQAARGKPCPSRAFAGQLGSPDGSRGDDRQRSGFHGESKKKYGDLMKLIEHDGNVR